MTGSGFGRLAALLAATLFVFFALAGEARASHTSHVEQSCFAYGSLDTDPARVALPSTRWDCSGARVSLEPDRVFLRFELPKAGELPDHVTFRRAAFERLHVMAVDA